jgi:hypothetical protein
MQFSPAVLSVMDLSADNFDPLAFVVPNLSPLLDPNMTPAGDDEFSAQGDEELNHELSNVNSTHGLSLLMCGNSSSSTDSGTIGADIVTADIVEKQTDVLSDLTTCTDLEPSDLQMDDSIVNVGTHSGCSDDHSGGVQALNSGMDAGSDMGEFTNIGSDDLSGSAQTLNLGTHSGSDMGKVTNISSDDHSGSAQVLNSGTHARSDMGEVTNISSDDHSSGAQTLNLTRWSTRLMKQKGHTSLNAEQDLDVLSISSEKTLMVLGIPRAIQVALKTPKTQSYPGVFSKTLASRPESLSDTWLSMEDTWEIPGCL